MIKLLKYLYQALFTNRHDTYPTKIKKDEQAKQERIKRAQSERVFHAAPTTFTQDSYRDFEATEIMI